MSSERSARQDRLLQIPTAVRFVKDVPRAPGPHGDKVQRAKLRTQAIKEVTP